MSSSINAFFPSASPSCHIFSSCWVCCCRCCRRRKCYFSEFYAFRFYVWRNLWYFAPKASISLFIFCTIFLTNFGPLLVKWIKKKQKDMNKITLMLNVSMAESECLTKWCFKCRWRNIYFNCGDEIAWHSTWTYIDKNGTIWVKCFPSTAYFLFPTHNKIETTPFWSFYAFR